MVLRECVCFMLLSFAPNMAPARNIQRCTRKHRLPRTGGHSCPCVYRQRLRYLCELMLARCTLPAARAATKAQTGASKPIIAIKITGGVGDYARYLRDPADQVEPISFDVYCNNTSTAEWIFESVPGFNA